MVQVQDAAVVRSVKHRSSKKTIRKTHASSPTPHELRKERRRLLVEQVESMQNELDRLKFLMLVNQGEIGKATRRTQAENSKLLGFIQGHYLTLATTQAALMGHVQHSVSTLLPLQSVIQLGSDQAKRSEVLLSLKDRMIDNGARYLSVRCHGMNPWAPYSQEERLDTPDGDYCIIRFETRVVPGASLKDVFAAILGVALNAEMYLSEMFGHITIREDNDFESTEFAQQRLVSSTSGGATVESNTVVFSKLVKGGNSVFNNYGIMVEDFVDADELYPYQTHERIRRDCTSVVMAQEVPATSDRPPAIAITRWTSFKIHNDSLSISKSPETELKESSVCWGDTPGNIVQQQIAQ